MRRRCSNAIDAGLRDSRVALGLPPPHPDRAWLGRLGAGFLQRLLEWRPGHHSTVCSRKEHGMNADIRRKLEMGFRALTFSRAHPDSSAGFATALTRLEERMARGEALATQQRSGVIAERIATARKRELRTMLHRTMLHHVARVAEAASEEQPELARKFRLPKDNGSFQAFRTAARGMVEEAQAQKVLLVSHGLSEPLLDGLVLALDQFDEAMDQAAAGRHAHVGAGADLEAVVQEVVQVVSVMDGLNRFRFANDAERLAAWESASNVITPNRGDGEVQAPVVEQIRPAA